MMLHQPNGVPNRISPDLTSGAHRRRLVGTPKARKAPRGTHRRDSRAEGRIRMTSGRGLQPRARQLTPPADWSVSCKPVPAGLYPRTFEPLSSRSHAGHEPSLDRSRGITLVFFRRRDGRSCSSSRTCGDT